MAINPYYKHELHGSGNYPPNPVKTMDAAAAFVQSIRDHSSVFSEIFHGAAGQKNYVGTDIAILNPRMFGTYLLFEQIDKSPNYSSFQKIAPKIFRDAVDAATFNRLKTVPQALAGGTLAWKNGIDGAPTLQTLMAGELVRSSMEFVPWQLDFQIYLDVASPHFLRLVDAFKMQVGLAGPEQLNALAIDLKNGIGAQYKWPGANRTLWNEKWKMLFQAENLPDQGYNDLFYAAAFLGHSKKISLLMNSPHARKITSKNIEDALFHFMSHGDVKNLKILRHHFFLISDHIFTHLLRDVLAKHHNPKLVEFFREFCLDRIRMIQPDLNPELAEAVNAQFFPPNQQFETPLTRDRVRAEIDQDMLAEEVTRIIAGFSNSVQNATPQELIRYAQELPLLFESDPILADAYWTLLMKAPQLPVEAFNDLILAAAGANCPQKVSSALTLKGAHLLLSPLDAKNLLRHLINNRDSHNFYEMRNHLFSMSDNDFKDLLKLIVANPDPTIVQYFKNLCLPRINTLFTNYSIKIGALADVCFPANEQWLYSIPRSCYH